MPEEQAGTWPKSDTTSYSKFLSEHAPMAQPIFCTATTIKKKVNEHIPLPILSMNAQGLYSKFALFQAMLKNTIQT